MKKTLKWVGIALLGLTSLFLLALLFVNIYRKEILEAVNQKLKEEINGDIHIDKLGFTIFHDFPNASLSLRNFYMRGPRYDEFRHDFLKAEIIEINVEALKLFQREVSVKSVDVINGEIFIFKTRSGYTNLDILKRTKKRDTTSHGFGQVNFKNINLKNVEVSFHDSLKQKEFGVRFLNTNNTIAPNDSSTRFHIGGDLRFVGLMFNAEKGSYLKNKQARCDFSLEFFPHKGQLIVHPSTLTLTKSDILLSGLFQFTGPKSFRLSIQSDSLDYDEGLSVVTQSLSSKLEKFRIEKKVNINVMVGGSLVPGSKPAVDLTFAVRNSKVLNDKIELNPITFQGSLTNHFDSTINNDDRNILLSLDTLYGKLNGLSFAAHALVRDFENPHLNMNARFDIDLKTLNADTLSEVNFKSGRFTSDFSYNGTLEEYLDTKIKAYKGKLDGVAKVEGGEIEYGSQQMTFEHLEASVRFSNEECQIENISMVLNKSPIAIKGLFRGFVPFFTQPDTRVKAFLTVNSPKLDVGKIFVKKKAKKLSDEKAAKKKMKIADLIDQLYKKLEVEVAFDIKQFLHKNFKAENLTGKILLVDDRLQVKGVKMKLAGGQVDFSASLNQLQRKINPFTLTAKVKNANISDFFYSFNNFNQTTIRHENLSGKVNVDITLQAAINDELDIMTPRMAGDVMFKLKNGRLKDFEPLQKMSNFLFKNRDLSDVQFGEINARFKMKGTEFDISRMEVQSTILTLYLEGRYSLIDNTDLSIQVPLNNLKSRNQDIPPENIGPGKRVGASVFLRAHKGKDGTTVVTYDPFKKALKKNKTVKMK